MTGRSTRAESSAEHHADPLDVLDGVPHGTHAGTSIAGGGRMMPARILMVVDLPAPFGPM